MKVQTLNKKQQARLLILCNEFFPEYYFDIIEEELNGNYPIIILELTLKSEVDDAETEIEPKYIEIHWYQLCLTELPKWIWKKIDKEWANDALGNGFKKPKEEFLHQLFYSKHPVDFLWNFVQEAKKNKYFKK